MYIQIQSPKIDKIWGIRGSDYNIPKAIFYLLKGDHINKLQIST